MSTKRKNDAGTESRYRVLALMLIGIGALVFVSNAVFSIVTVRSNGQVFEEIARNVSETATNASQGIGTVAENAGDFGSVVGEAVGGLGESFGNTAGSLWPLLLIVVGLALILRRPATKAKNDELSAVYADEQD